MTPASLSIVAVRTMPELAANYQTQKMSANGLSRLMQIVRFRFIQLASLYKPHTPNPDLAPGLGLPHTRFRLSSIDQAHTALPLPDHDRLE